MAGDTSKNSENLNQYIDHTLLRPDAKEADIIKVCDEALEYRFRTVCIEPQWLPLVVTRLEGSNVLPITVIAFPGGEDATESKVLQARDAVAAGAKEVDMVMNRTLLKSRRYTEFYLDVISVVNIIPKTPVKVILETSELTYEEKVLACGLCKAAGAAFVKTSTGFSKSGATPEDVALMRAIVGNDVGVKASGGVRTREDALLLIAAGASRLGCSASVAIVKGEAATSRGY